MKRTACVWWLAILVWMGSAGAAENPGAPSERPAGSGVIVHADGYVLTAQHVVANARRIVVVTSGEFRAPAVVVSADQDHDLALLKIETVGFSEAPLGYAGAVRLDQEVIVSGFPFGLREVSVTRGRVAAVRTKGVNRVFQIDAAINPGSSGGAVFNRGGEVVGIVTTKFSHPSGIVPEGMAFAVPISYATPLLANIPDFDFTAIGKGKRGRKAELEDERVAQELARVSVRIDTLRIPDAVPAQTAPNQPAASQSRAEARRPPAPRPEGPTHDPGAGNSDDPDSIAKANQQHAAAQLEELQRLTQRGIQPPDGMVLIPGGEFQMGAEDALPDARPLHRVYLSPYWIDKYEVSNAQYRRCVDSGICQPPKVRQAFEDPLRAQYPVTNVTWTQARTYCQWHGRRLPTEAEWEKAARGDDGRRYPWGNSDNALRGWLKDRDLRLGNDGTVPVGSLPEAVSPYGVFDLAGNVWEWVKDWYAEDFYVSAPSHDPQGPLRGSFRVLRGGDWSQSPVELRVTYRGWDEMTYWGPTLGFRCADDVP